MKFLVMNRVVLQHVLNEYYSSSLFRFEYVCHEYGGSVLTHCWMYNMVCSAEQNLYNCVASSLASLIHLGFARSNTAVEIILSQVREGLL